VRVFGESPINNDRLYRQLGYCPSSEGLYASVSAFEWVRYLQELGGMSRTQASVAAEQALELVGMRDAMHRAIAGYSRGMRQRTKLAQAIAHNPPLLILDEPFNGLDPIGRHEMTVALRTWIDQGKSLLLASHVLHDIEAITLSFLLICGSRLLASGTAEEVHKILVDLPNEITLRCDRPHELAQRIVALALADRVEIGTDTVTAATRRPSQLLAQLPVWSTNDSLLIHEVRSADESLQSLFNSLLRIHRGEI
jgi:ABC-2 type transport system ATP-binding protein